MANRLDGSSSLAYMGVKPTQPPQLLLKTRRPTVTDGIGFPLGTMWMIPQQDVGVVPQEEVWILVGARQNIFTWKRLRGSGGTTPFAINAIVYDTAGTFTYTPTDGMIEAIIECVGGGGGGGGAASTGAGTMSAASGGSGGGYSRKVVSLATIGASQTITVGDGGAGGAAGNNNGIDGETTSIGSIISATGGGGGQGGSASATSANMAIPTNPGIGSSGDINISGGIGDIGYVTNNAGVGYPMGGYGGGSFYGTGAPKAGNDTGNGAFGYGAGGGGASCTINNVTGFEGAPGTNGVVVITEYF